MKIQKLIAIGAIALIALPVFAEKREASEYLPKSGDFAISVNGIPFDKYIGQLFNGTNGNVYDEFAAQPYLNGDVKSGGFQKLDPILSVSGKYFLENDFAVRINCGWLFSYDKTRAYAYDDLEKMLNPLSEQKVIDARVDRTNGASFMAGVEQRLGKRRVQGFVGGGAIYAFQKESHTYSYGNAITALNQKPSVGFDPADIYFDRPGYTAQRFLKSFSQDATRYVGLVGFVGVEWFFTPKISIGGEVNVAAVAHFTREKWYTAEGYNLLSGQVDTWTEKVAPSGWGFDFGTGNIGSNISLNFYF